MKQVVGTHPPPSPFALRSLTTPTQRCWYCGGGQVPEDGGGWEIDSNGMDRDYFLGFGKCNVIEQSHLKVALLDDEAVPSFGAELPRRVISSSNWSDSQSPSQKVPLRASPVNQSVFAKFEPTIFADQSFTIHFLKGVFL